MIRACAWCKAFLGVKCPECGGEAKFHRVDANERVYAVCVNQGCVVSEFAIGENGATHAICEPCKNTRMPARPSLCRGSIPRGAA